MIVVDVNVIAFYLSEGNRTSDAQTLRRLDPLWAVPPFWAIEFQSILWKACPERVYSLTAFIDRFSGGLNLREKAATYSTIRRKKTLPVSQA